MIVPLLAFAAPAYRIVDLGLPPGAESVEAVAINDRDEVLVTAFSPDPIYGGRRTLSYLWRSGNYIGFGESPYAGLDGPNVQANALNDFGAAAGACGGLGPIFMSGLADEKAFVWNGRKMALLFPKDQVAQEALSVNNKGDIVGSDGHGAFAKLRGKIVGLPEASHVEPRDPDGEMGDVNRSSAATINDHRLILMNSTYGGKRGDTDLPSRPFLVDGNAKRLRLCSLPLPKGYANAVGYDLNDAGTVLAGGYSSGTNGTWLYLVRKGKVEALGMLKGIVRPARMNAQDDVVATVSSYRDVKKTELALWLRGHRVPFPTFDGWTLQTVVDVNDHGAVCGTGLHEGKTRAYILLPL